MKKFYIVFFITFIILSALLYISSWWFLTGVAIIVLITAYQFHNARLRAFKGSVEELGLLVEELQKQLDRSLAKEEKATNEVMQIRDQKKELLTSLSHEIRTPMNGVLSMSLLLKDTSLTKEQNDYIDTIITSGESLIAAINEILVSDIVEYSKVESRVKKTETIDFDLRNTVEEVVNMFVTTAIKKEIELLVDIDENAPLQLNGDNRRLREILMNLVENAIKFTQHGQVLVSVLLLSKNDNDPVIRFEVSDTGIGISDEQLKQLFYTVPARGFERRKKTNRGLLICSKHAKQMGGKIEVTSSPGEGSSFFFTVHFQRSEKTFLQTEQHAALKILDGKNILVIDDNTASRNIISKQLITWKTNSRSAGSASEALGILENAGSFDLILVDLVMPHMDGLQFARTVKRSNPDQKLVLLNSAWNESYKHEQELFAGIFRKPLRHHIFRDNMIALFESCITERNNEQSISKKDFASGHPLKILVAEDNPVNQKIAIKILDKLGYTVQIANNGKEVIDLLTADNYDIVLMDVQMPEMDGLEATRIIRTQMQMQPIIIALTANVLQGDHDACIQAGMNDYLSKPIVLDDLISKLEKGFVEIEANKH